MSLPHRVLSELLYPWASAPSVAVTDVSLASGDVTPGALFLAVRGRRGHGADHLREALERGARAVAWEPAPGTDAAGVDELCRSHDAVSVLVPALSGHVGAIAARFFGDPSREMTVIGVTGTDGKTSVTQFIAQALDQNDRGRRCGVIGTIGWGFPGDIEQSSHTTPDAVRLQRWLAALRARGAHAVAMEVSSHALDQGRADAVRFDVAVLTQLGRDHLDYHGSDENYAAAKARLFELVGEGVAVLNLDDDFGRRLAGTFRASTIGYSASGAPEARIRASDVQLRADGMGLLLHDENHVSPLDLPLIGRFNVANVLAVHGALRGAGLTFDDAMSRLDRLAPVPGRMERFVANGRPVVVVDYAHTPGALEAALETLREHAGARVLVVFGCGGDRDRGKRPLMGAVASRLADRVFLTNDNPRGEPPEAIIEAIAAGCDGVTPERLPDRRSAIAAAIAAAAPEDIVLVAGKGHETTQMIGAHTVAFSDRETVRELLGGVR